MATIRVAGVADAAVVAHLLGTFNREYETPTPGVEVLERRLNHLLAGDTVTAVLIEEPPVGLALVTLRPSVWYDGPVGLLDELYVAPDRRNLGLGTVLLRAAEDVVRRRGGEVLEINVDVDARRFYERHGYRNADCIDDVDILRSGATGEVVGHEVMAPSTVGTWLRQGPSQRRAGARVGQRAPQPRRGWHRPGHHHRGRAVRGVPAAR